VGHKVLTTRKLRATAPIFIIKEENEILIA